MVQTGIPSNTIRGHVGQTGNLSEKGKSIMYNRNGKRIGWWERELVLPHKLESPESWAFWFNKLKN